MDKLTSKDILIFNKNVEIYNSRIGNLEEAIGRLSGEVEKHRLALTFILSK
jgi:hypothetical protein